MVSVSSTTRCAQTETDTAPRTTRATVSPGSTPDYGARSQYAILYVSIQEYASLLTTARVTPTGKVRHAKPLSAARDVIMEHAHHLIPAYALQGGTESIVSLHCAALPVRTVTALLQLAAIANTTG
jgi:hypothetical protein